MSIANTNFLKRNLPVPSESSTAAYFINSKWKRKQTNKKNKQANKQNTSGCKIDAENGKYTEEKSILAPTDF